MASLAPFGLSPSQAHVGPARAYIIRSTDTNAYAVGDPVKSTDVIFQGRLPDSRPTQGLPGVTKAASGDRIRGVIVGIAAASIGSDTMTIPATKARDYVVEVNDDPRTIYEVQADNTSVLAALAGSYANFIAASPTGSVSGLYLDSTSFNNSAGDFRVLSVAQNDGANSRLRVILAFHEDSTAAAVHSLVVGYNSYPWAVHPNLWAQLSATTMIADTPLPYDLSGNNRTPSRGANLSIAQLNGTPGYFSTLLAGSNGDDPSLHFPSINFDYDGGEILLMGCLFKMAAPAADGALLANASSASSNGFRFRTRTTGYIDISLFSTTGAVSSFSGNSSNVLLDNTLHHIGLMINGRTKTRSFWEDCALTRDGVGFLASCDTRESTALNIGSVLAVPTAISHTSANTIRAMFIMRWGPNDTAPTTANITSLMFRHRANPGRVIAAGDL